MKYLLIIIIVIQLVWLYLVFTEKRFTINLNRQTPTMTKQEIVRFCQEMSAIAINDKWNYKNCIENLENPNDAKILKI